MKCTRVFLISIFLCCRHASPAEGVFSTISVKNFDKLADGRSYLAVLFYKENHEACDKAMKEFRIAARSFDLFQEVIFGMVDVTKDRVMALRFNMEIVPSLLLFPYSKSPLPFLQPIGSEDIVNTITASRLENKLYSSVHKNEHLLGQHFTDVHAKRKAREVTEANFKKEVLDNEKFALVSLYKDGCKDECTVMDMLHSVFRDDDNIAIVKMDVTKAPNFANQYQMSHNPTLLWFPPEDKLFGKIYGGEIIFRELVSFLNSETGAERDLDGRIKENAGRIEEFDQVLKNRIVDLISSKGLKGILADLKKLSKNIKAPKRFVDYYIKILETSLVRGTIDQVMETENDYITKRLSEKKISTKERDEWTKFRNIISGIVDMAARRLLDISAKTFEKDQQYQREANLRKKAEAKPQNVVEEPQGEDVAKEPVQWVEHRSHDEL